MKTLTSLFQITLQATKDLSKKIGNDFLVLLAQLGQKNLPKTVDEALSYLQTDEHVAGIAPPGAKVVTYSIYGDSTTLDCVRRSISGHPIVIQYTNEPRSKSQTPTGFLTALNYQMHHFILRLSVVPSDMLEQYAIGKIKGTKALSPCIICMVPKGCLHCVKAPKTKPKGGKSADQKDHKLRLDPADLRL
ncbi:hypothetical protein BCR33DRAFT_745071 [Rhizoclosmatium globosum]|uniref:Uncharacterized protein n=1 Tax=Rhizoclosmatium globosum TaxID=329046 RepID=A0A1Y2B4W1_9FUNG|nr:hypothetical protein BCR33DRAFT_745071 [Rhizoclosmatium globosum]|eukprot:ORY29869.1 hypothetical protein BCR33DRAFT_745071 [Rhizoclosmatium globosum]